MIEYVSGPSAATLVLTNQHEHSALYTTLILLLRLPMDLHELGLGLIGT